MRESVSVFATFFFVLFSGVFSTFAAEKSEIYKDSQGIAIRGYDAVAYFEQRKPVKGKKEFEYEWKGARWHFASAAHRDLFAQDPVKYAPQYGGYCAYGVSKGHLSETDPNAWKIVDGKLYFNYDFQVGILWRRDIPGNITKADQYWPHLVSLEAKP